MHGDSRSFYSIASEVRADAERGNASENQLDIIDAAIDDGELSFDDLTVAFHEFGACLDDVGIDVYEYAGETVPGWPSINFEVAIDHSRFPGGQEQGELLLDQCMEQEYSFVSRLYDLQPVALEAYDAALADHIPAIAGCLESYGLEVDATLPAAEFRAEVTSRVNAAAKAGEAVGGDASLAVVDCFGEWGFMSLP